MDGTAETNYMVKEMFPGCYLLAFSDRETMARSFMRVSEFYESPRWKGRYFTVDEFEDWYKGETGKSEFTYCKDWAGFNVPGLVIEKWLKVFANNFTSQEKRLIEVLTILGDLSKAYILATEYWNEHALSHEVCHALYYLSDSYRKNVQEIIGDQYEALLEEQRTPNWEVGYDENVRFDETQAFCSTTLAMGATKKTRQIRRRLAENFQNFKTGKA